MKLKQIALFFYFGRRSVSMIPADRQLKDYPSGQFSYPTVGRAGTATIGKVVLEVEPHSGAVLVPRKSYAIDENLIGYVSAGYVLAQSGRLRVYPLLGVGVPDVCSEEGVSTSQVGMTISNANVSGQVGIGVDYRLGWRIGLLISLRLGYDLSSDGRRSFFVRAGVGPGLFAGDGRQSDENETGTP